MERAPTFDTLRFTRTLVDAGVERRHAEAHAKAASAAIGATAMKAASAEGLRAVDDRLDGLYRALWLQAASIVYRCGRAHEAAPVAVIRGYANTRAWFGLQRTPQIRPRMAVRRSHGGNGAAGP